MTQDVVFVKSQNHQPQRGNMIIANKQHPKQQKPQRGDIIGVYILIISPRWGLKHHGLSSRAIIISPIQG